MSLCDDFESGDFTQLAQVAAIGRLDCLRRDLSLLQLGFELSK
jgi:hypothetical protein